MSNDDMEAAMKTLAARMVLATSVALATLAAAHRAYAQDYQSAPVPSDSFQGNPKTLLPASLPFRLLI
jgi:hypothetical protein